ncbi:translation initiation factor 5B [Marchantia polymorpha subsp. ruderalis]|uniref:Eukaryotic translation initiation factor 5B n=2 Tax=Marchantia polymorpha TaxID=3197 RepID=A0AAF6B812_MARPO|nr:hypothetical protein MARPO_0112s0026 [Marchantia polymorpha]BBN08146.1 hypothetical protein Mp_4g09260 [Marchantia polymorpha subsp. ruderalis]|eukprot:PTQ31370.1 hypothetical protein MARPO_0112s0026 [Marchantia polymorpha]
MGRKKPTSAAVDEFEPDSASVAQAPSGNAKKGKKKGAVKVDDDEYMVEPAVEESVNGEQERGSGDLEADLADQLQDLSFSGKKKTKGKNAKKAELDSSDVSFQQADETSLEEFVGGSKKKGAKKGKKGNRVDDDEYEVSESVDVESTPSEVPSFAEESGAGNKKKGKKGKKGTKGDDDDFDVEISEPAISVQSEDFGAKKKGGKKGKKGGRIDDDEYEIPELVESEQVAPVEPEEPVFSGKKKAGKKGKKGAKVDDDEYELQPTIEAPAQLDETPEPEEPIFSGKKKAAKKGKKGAKLDDDEYELPGSNEAGSEDPMVIDELEAPKKSEKKAGKKATSTKPADLLSLLAGLDEGSVEAGDEDAEERTAPQSTQKENGDLSGDEVVFSGKKKAKGKKAPKVIVDDEITNGGGLDANAGLREEASVYVEVEPEVDDEVIAFSGKKKPKKGKKEVKKDVEADDMGETAELPSLPTVSSPPVEPSPSVTESSSSSKKNKKKGKKSGRTAQEEEDLDALLAELDGPVMSKAPPKSAAPSETPAESQPIEEQPADEVVPEAPAVAEGEEVVESAAAKKKKKKKEKEKAAKAAATEKPVDEEAAESAKPKEEAKGKAAEKKIPKHLKAMQEQLAKIREAEEKRKREEEERRRKEEEEQARLEELERQKEEAKKRRKEREKEKLLQKKKEGKLLTGKQKEEARRLAMMREQMLAQAGIAVDSIDGAPVDAAPAAPRKPKYDSKKKKRGPNISQQSEQAADLTKQEISDAPIEEVEEVEEVPVEVPMEVEVAVEEEVAAPEPPPEEKSPEPEEEEEEEDWDAKSFEDVALPAIKSAFAEDEELDKRESLVVAPVPGKSTKRVVAQAPAPPAKRAASPEKRPTPAPKRGQQPHKGPHKAAPPPAESEEEETESEEEEESEEEDDADTKKKRLAKDKREARKAEALSKRSADDLRSPICCILGHVDTGKTKLLDCIRRTNVQEGEAGGITQQIGATYFPMANIRERTKELKAVAEMRVPGLLVIDTPGHESFTNLRARGSSLCDIAILVIDIMHGLEPQTIESLKLLQMRKTPFIVALNKVDRLYDWKSTTNAPIRNSMKNQSKHVIQEFETRTNQIITQLKEQGMNSELYYKNKEIRKVVSIVPTSAISGEGVPDLLMLLVQLTQKMMEEKLMYVAEVQCTVLEVKVIEGLGTTIDVVLVNGVLHEGDQIVVCGMQGPIVTSIRALLTPHPMKELRVKGSYEKHKELKAAQGIKITGQGLEHAIAGTQLYVVGPEDELEDIKEEAMQDMKNVMSRVDKTGEGVCVQASTLGSLEALLEFLKSPAVKIPVSGINIGPVHKRDVMRASVMLERKRKEYATILAFDVKVTQEAKELADEVGVKIFTADIIYHLFDQFTNYINTVKEEKRKETAEEAVFPCVLKLMPGCIFNKKDPIIVGVDVVEGIAKVGTPLCIPSREFIEIGRIASMEVNHKVVDTAKKGNTVAMKIVGTNAEETQKMYGRHFDMEDEFVSSITRKSIDLLKENYRDDLTMEDWRLLVKLKKLFEIP